MRIDCASLGRVLLKRCHASSYLTHPCTKEVLSRVQPPLACSAEGVDDTMSRRWVKGTRASTKTRRRRSRNIFERGIQPRAHAYHSENEIILGLRVQDSDESCMKMAALANLRHQAGPQICARREASVQTAGLFILWS